MAGQAAVAAPSEAALRQLVDTNRPPAPLAQLHLVGETEDAVEWRAAAHILRYRENGFMAVLPHTEQIEAFLGVVSEAAEPVLSRVLMVECENSRRRALGEAAVLFCDFAWSCLPYFRRPARLRLSASPFTSVLADNQPARPVSSSAHVVADAWILEATDDLGEYVTAVEDEPELLPAGADAATAQPDHDRLLRDLEARLGQLEAGGPAAPRSTPPPLARARDMFPTEADGNALTASDLAALRAAAGRAPQRIGRVEAVADDELAELGAGAWEDADASALDPQAGPEVLHRLLAVQSALLRRVLAPKSSDPITAALGSGATGSDSSSSTGVRGYTAREAYIKHLAECKAFSGEVEANAMRELGVTATYPGLMRDFVQRRVPLGDQRQLCYYSTLFAFAWEAGATSNNHELMAWSARGLLFSEQVALDGGRSQFGWMLTGLPQPDWHILTSHKRKPHMMPYASLAKPSWAAANIAFLKELSYLETRLASGTTPPTVPAETEETPEQPNRPRRPRRPKGAAPT